jgi:hypothetical protein
VDECRFWVLEFLGDVSRQSEVGVLVDGARNKAGDVAHFAKDLGEGVGKRGCCLDGTKVYLADVVSDETKTSRFSLQRCFCAGVIQTHESVKPNVAFD